MNSIIDKGKTEAEINSQDEVREILLRMEQNRKNVQTAVIAIAIVLCVLATGAIVIYKKGDCATKRRLQERNRGYVFYDAYSSDTDRGLCISLGE